jgi:hypothetical protein
MAVGRDLANRVSRAYRVMATRLKLPRFQFRLRTLLIVVALLAVACAYVGWQAKIVKERHKAVASYQAIAGFAVEVDETRGAGGATTIFPEATIQRDADK